MGGGHVMGADSDQYGLPEHTLLELFDRAGHQCQCCLPHCDHSRRCDLELAWEDLGRTWLPVNLFPDDGPELEIPFKWFIYCTSCAQRWLKVRASVR